MTRPFGMNFTAFDFETSGLDPRTDQVIEACVIRVRNGEPVAVYNTLVQMNEGVTLAPKITELTGHSQADLVGGITEEALMNILAYMIEEDELLVAHNALFDMGFLAHGLRKYGFITDPNAVEGFDNTFIDTLTIARNREPYPHTLKDVCKRNGITLDDAHSAYADTFALVDVVLDMHSKRDITEWINVAGYRPKYGVPSWYPHHATLIKQGAEVIEHTKPKRAPQNTRQKVKPPTIVTTNNNRREQFPSDPVEFDRQCMPTALIDRGIQTKIDNFLDDPFEPLEFLSLNVEATIEFDKVYAYITKMRNVPEDLIGSWLDTPAEAVIEIHHPRFGYGRPIEISDDDLPF